MSMDNLVNNVVSDIGSEELLHKWDAIAISIDVDKITVKKLDNNIADKYVFDFNGLLAFLNIPSIYWYVHARLNNLSTGTDYNGKLDIYIINNEYLDNVFNTLTNKSSTY